MEPVEYELKPLILWAKINILLLLNYLPQVFCVSSGELSSTSSVSAGIPSLGGAAVLFMFLSSHKRAGTFCVCKATCVVVLNGLE
jgi:hypothetical protein